MYPSFQYAYTRQGLFPVIQYFTPYGVLLWRIHCKSGNRQDAEKYKSLFDTPVFFKVNQVCCFSYSMHFAPDKFISGFLLHIPQCKYRTC